MSDPASHNSVGAAIAAGIEAGRLQHDDGQSAVAQALDDLLPKLAATRERGWFRRRIAAPRTSKGRCAMPWRDSTRR